MSAIFNRFVKCKSNLMYLVVDVYVFLLNTNDKISVQNPFNKQTALHTPQFEHTHTKYIRFLMLFCFSHRISIHSIDINAVICITYDFIFHLSLFHFVIDISFVEVNDNCIGSDMSLKNTRK